jgi:hypothetical protein
VSLNARGIIPPLFLFSLLLSQKNEISGLMPSEKRYSARLKALETNYLWAHAHSPFGPFGTQPQLSELAVDQVVSTRTSV